LSKISRQTLDFKKPLNLSQAWGQILSRTQIDRETELAYSWISVDDLQRFNVASADFDGIANLISAGSSLNLGLFLVEYEKGKVKGKAKGRFGIPLEGKIIIRERSKDGIISSSKCKPNKIIELNISIEKPGIYTVEVKDKDNNIFDNLGEIEVKSSDL